MKQLPNNIQMTRRTLFFVFLLLPFSILLSQNDEINDNYSTNRSFLNDRYFYSLLEKDHFVMFAKNNWTVSFWKNNSLITGYSHYYKDHGYWLFESNDSISFYFQYSEDEVEVEVVWKIAESLIENSIVFYEIGATNKKQGLLEKWLSKSSNGDFYLNNRNAQILNDKGYYLDKIGIHGEAIVLLEFIILHKPQRVVAYINLGDAYWGLEEYEKAKQAYGIYIQQMKSAGRESRIPSRVIERVE